MAIKTAAKKTTKAAAPKQAAAKKPTRKAAPRKAQAGQANTGLLGKVTLAGVSAAAGALAYKLFAL